jgi:hypothetical protein
MKDREDAPPCTDCGLNMKEQWDYSINLNEFWTKNVGRW